MKENRTALGPSPFVVPIGFEPIAGFRVDPSTNPKVGTCFRVACPYQLLAGLFLEVGRLILPDSAYLILKAKPGEDPPQVNGFRTYVSDFLPTAELGRSVFSHLGLLINDGNVGFGLAWQDTSRHEEVFIDEHKILMVLTSHQQPVRGRLTAEGLQELPDLELVSQHPHGHGGLPDTFDQLQRELIEPLKMGLRPRTGLLAG